MKKILLTTLILLFVLAACAPVAPATDEPIPLGSPTAPPVDMPLPTQSPTEPGNPSNGQMNAPASIAARNDLANIYGISLDDIALVSMDKVDWPDGCLGIVVPGLMCNQMVTPGYKIVLKTGDLQFEYHTNLEGTYVKIAGDAHLLNPIDKPVLVWQSAACNILSVAAETAYGKCIDANLTSVQFITPGNNAIVFVWAEKYQAFEAETPAGKVTLNGTGPLVATASEQRMIAEWASLTYDVASSGRAGAAWGLALSWSREGGFAGFCDNVGVYRNGLVNVSNCGGTNINFRLTASQLDQLYNLLDTFSTIDYEHTDPATADAMTVKLNFSGLGQQTAAASDISAINEFVAGLVAQAQLNVNAPTDRAEAEGALQDFFGALNHGDYIKGAKLYGGDTSLLETWNPDITNNLPKWLERACTQNGLQCLLPRSVTYRGPDERGGYQFYVEFNNADGTLFYQGPCCGDTSGLRSSNFLVSVIRQNDLWLVMDLPPYVP